MTETMQAVVVDDGVPGRMRLGEVRRPLRQATDVLVRVHVVSLNRGEIKTALAAPSGFRPGWDFAGVVAQAADEGTSFPAGTRVVGLMPFGAWADYVAVPQPAIAVLPDNVSFDAAATLPVAGLTARAALARGVQRDGARILITGASGGVGTLAIQLAKLQGADVTAAIRNPAHEPLVRRLGAAHVAIGEALDGAAQFGPYDLILESVGGETLGRALSLLASGGTCVLFGASSGNTTTFDTSRFRVGGTSLYGLVMQHELARTPPSVGLRDLLGLLHQQKLDPVIERRGSIADISRIADDLVQRRFVGKAVLSLH
jgi:NADPH:quinone reductase-like Zn-dependent oxidoreductase